MPPEAARNRLRQALMVKFGLPPDRPTREELDTIISALPDRRNLTEQEWREVVYRHVKFEGFYKRAGLDLSDLNVLLAMARAQTSSSQRPR